MARLAWLAPGRLPHALSRRVLVVLVRERRACGSSGQGEESLPSLTEAEQESPLLSTSGEGLGFA